MKTYVVELPWMSDTYITKAISIESAFNKFFLFLLNDKKCLSIDTKMLSKRLYNNNKSIVATMTNCCGEYNIHVHECIEIT